MIEAQTPDGTLPVRELTDRPEAQAYAEANGYFWLPCLTCGQWSGGHEWDGRSIPNDVNLPGLDPDRRDSGLSTGICPACIEAGVHVTWCAVSGDPLAWACLDYRDTDEGPQRVIARAVFERAP